MTPNLGLKTKVKAGTDMWAESADMQTEAVKVGETPQEAGGRGQRGLGPSSVGNRKKEETEQGESKRHREVSSPLNTHLRLQSPLLIQNQVTVIRVHNGALD